MSKKSSVIEFIEKERAEGKSNRQIKHDLLDAGWHMDIIKHALGELEKGTIQPAIISRPRFTKKELTIAGCSIFLLILLLAIFV